MYKFTTSNPCYQNTELRHKVHVQYKSALSTSRLRVSLSGAHSAWANRVGLNRAPEAECDLRRLGNALKFERHHSIRSVLFEALPETRSTYLPLSCASGKQGYIVTCVHVRRSCMHASYHASDLHSIQFSLGCLWPWLEFESYQRLARTVPVDTHLNMHTCTYASPVRSFCVQQLVGASWNLRDFRSDWCVSVFVFIDWSKQSIIKWFLSSRLHVRLPMSPSMWFDIEFWYLHLGPVS